jgi:hypothetical protein
MALIDEYRAAVENDTEFRQRVTIAVSRVVMAAMTTTNTPDATTKPPAQQALAKRFLLDPGSEVSRYLLPIAARMAIVGASYTDDAAVNAAAQFVLTLNVQLGVS